MSAIQRDREIAEKATDGEWAQSTIPTVIRGPNNVRIGATASTSDPTPQEERDNAEHIVRLHNRQPKYDALERAVRRIVLRHRDDGPSIDPCVRDDLIPALAALDQEEP